MNPDVDGYTKTLNHRKVLTPKNAKNTTDYLKPKEY